MSKRERQVFLLGSCVQLMGPAHKTCASNAPAVDDRVALEAGMVSRVGTSNYGGWYEIECGLTVEYRRRGVLQVITDVEAQDAIRKRIEDLNQQEHIKSAKAKQRDRERERERLRAANKKKNGPSQAKAKAKKKMASASSSVATSPVLKSKQFLAKAKPMMLKRASPLDTEDESEEYLSDTEEDEEDFSTDDEFSAPMEMPATISNRPKSKRFSSGPVQFTAAPATTSVLIGKRKTEKELTQPKKVPAYEHAEEAILALCSIMEHPSPVAKQQLPLAREQSMPSLSRSSSAASLGAQSVSSADETAEHSNSNSVYSPSTTTHILTPINTGSPAGGFRSILDTSCMPPLTAHFARQPIHPLLPQPLANVSAHNTALHQYDYDFMRSNQQQQQQLQQHINHQYMINLSLQQQMQQHQQQHQQPQSSYQTLPPQQPTTSFLPSHHHPLSQQSYQQQTPSYFGLSSPSLVSEHSYSQLLSQQSTPTSLHSSSPKPSLLTYQQAVFRQMTPLPQTHRFQPTQILSC